MSRLRRVRWGRCGRREKSKIEKAKKDQMRRKPVINPQAVRDFEEKIVRELLRYVPGPGAPDAIDVKDAQSVAPLLKKFDWPAIQRIGSWLFSDDGWPYQTRTGSGVKILRPGEPSNEVLGRLRALLRQADDE